MPEKGLGNIKLNEDKDKCLFCIPIDIGVKLIGVLICLGAINAVQAILQFNASYYDDYFVIVYGVCAAPLIYSAILFIKYYMKNSSETRAALPKACIFVIFSGVATCVWTLVYLLGLHYRTYWANEFLRTCLLCAIYCVLYLYFAGVCQRYAA